MTEHDPSTSDVAVTSAALHRRREAATPRGVAVLAPFFAARADGAELWDVDGKRYIDLSGGIAAVGVGHRHPRVMAAVAAQLEAFTHTCYQIVPYAGVVELAERLNALVPGEFAKKTTFFTTGAEAVENAVKIARAHTRRPGVITFTGGFHGRTLMALALTGKVAPYKLGFGPFPGDVHHAPFPSPLHGVTADDALAAVDRILRADIEPERVAAIIIEPVQGEGGFYVAPPALLRGLRELCDRHGIVLVADEIQTGFARTGTLFAMEQHDVAADLIVMAKGLANGFPLSAVTGRAEIMDAPAPGGLGGTYAAHPPAVAAALAVLDVIADDGLCSRAVHLGELVRARLDALAAAVPHVAEVRGLGAMLAFELRDPATGAPAPELTRRVHRAALDRGVLVLSCGVHANVIRLLMPLTITDALLGDALDVIDAAVRDEAAR